AELAQVHRQDLAGVRRGERDPALDAALVGVDGREERFAGDEALAGAEQLADQAAAAVPRRVAEHRVHPDAGVHEHHAAGLADRRLAGIELYLDELHLATVDLVVHHVHRHRPAPVVRRRADSSGAGLRPPGASAPGPPEARTIA